MASNTQHETKAGTKILHDWIAFCESKGFVDGQAPHACRLVFMGSLSADEREIFISQVMQLDEFAGTPKRERGSAGRKAPPFKPFPR